MRRNAEIKAPGHHCAGLTELKVASGVGVGAEESRESGRRQAGKCGQVTRLLEGRCQEAGVYVLADLSPAPLPFLFLPQYLSKPPL